MEDFEHTIAELMNVPMENWLEWIERRELGAAEVLAIERWLAGDGACAGRPVDGDERSAAHALVQKRIYTPDRRNHLGAGQNEPCAFARRETDVVAR